MIIRTVTTGLLLAFTAAAAHAAPVGFTPDVEKSHITFTATQNDAAVAGEFRAFTADIAFHPDALAESQVTVTVDMASVNAGYDEVVSTLATEDWFNSSAYRHAVFATQSFTHLGDNRYEAAATLTIKDHVQPVTLQFTLHDFSENAAHMTGETTLKRTDFAIGWEDTSTVEDDVVVKVEIHAEAAQQP